MVEKYQAWRSSDGSLFESEQAAKDHEFVDALTKWAVERTGVGDGGLPFDWQSVFDAIVEDRVKLLPIFKLLNGGSPISAPVQMSERASADVVDLPR